MPTKLVDDVRALLAARREAEQPVTAVERTLLLTSVGMPGRGGEDVVDELEQAIRQGRQALEALTPDTARAAIGRLLAAGRAVLDYEPPEPPPPTPEPDDTRRRADTDG